MGEISNGSFSESEVLQATPYEGFERLSGCFQPLNHPLSEDRMGFGPELQAKFGLQSLTTPSECSGPELQAKFGL